MQRDVSTNIRLPEGIWRGVKIEAARQGRSMKDLIVEALRKTFGIKAEPSARSTSLRDLLLEFSGKIEAEVTDGSTQHDRYIYDEK